MPTTYDPNVLVYTISKQKIAFTGHEYRVVGVFSMRMIS